MTPFVSARLAGDAVAWTSVLCVWQELHSQNEKPPRLASRQKLTLEASSGSGLFPRQLLIGVGARGGCHAGGELLTPLATVWSLKKMTIPQIECGFCQFIREGTI